MPYQLIHGEEEFFRVEAVRKLKAEFTQKGLGDLNITSLEGRKLNLPVLREACETMPFLAERRLVLVYNLLERCDPAGKAENEEESPEAGQNDPAFCKDLTAYLPNIPVFSHVAFYDTPLLSARNPVLRYAQGDKQATITLCNPLENDALHAWVNSRITEKQSVLGLNADGRRLTIQGDAVRVLVNQVGNNLRQLDTELDKLAGFADYGTISIDHVHQLAAENLEARIFSMVDALGRRERKTALHELSQLLATGAHPLYILTMVVRQYRMLIMTKELVEDKHADARLVAQELKVRDFAAEKLLLQARLYQVPELSEIYRDLVLVDQRIKTGKVEGDLALELLVMDITRGVHQGKYPERTLRAS